jgi:hypothetical protein
MSKTRSQIWKMVVGLALFLIIATLALSPVKHEASAQGSSYGWVQVDQVVLSGTGTDGAVSASDRSSGSLYGHLYAVHLDFSSSITTTTDITITQSSPSLTVLQLTDYYTDTWFYPAAEYTNSAGTGLSAYEPLLVADRLTVAAGETISSSTIMTATLYWGQ